MSVHDEFSRPLLSIVIANYNYGCFLKDAIESVLTQDVDGQVELIICDAASTDDSVDVIERYSNGLPEKTSLYEWQHDTNISHVGRPCITWWCSERDGGQSAAFNKGFAHARGRFLTWLNADDLLLPGTLRRLKLAMDGHPDCEWFVGGCFWLDPMLRVFKCGRARRMSRYRAQHGFVNVCGPSSFFSKDLYERAGKIDERFHYTMDTDLWLRFAIKENVVFRPFVDYAWGLRLHPKAKMSGHKFTSDGKILEGRKSREAFRKEETRMKQLELEEQWSNEKVGVAFKAMSRVMRFFSADFIPALLSRVDTRRFIGMRLVDVMGLKDR